MFRCARAVVMNTAPRDDSHVRSLADIKIVVYGVMEIPNGQQYGYMHRSVRDARLYDDINAVLIRFGNDFDVCGGIARQQLPVFTDIETSLGNTVQIRNGFQQFFIEIVHCQPP